MERKECLKKKQENDSVNDEFLLYDIVVEVVRCQKGKRMVCNHKLGDKFFVHGENLSFPVGQSFPIYPLAAILPLIPAKQRSTDPNDWMSTDQEIACPDPHCGGVFRICRIGTSSFKHSEVTITPLKKGDCDE